MIRLYVLIGLIIAIGGIFSGRLVDSWQRNQYAINVGQSSMSECPPVTTLSNPSRADVRHWALQGQLAVHEARWEAADCFLTAVDQQMPNDAVTILGRADVAFAQNEYDQALQLYVSITDYNSIFRGGIALLQQGETQLAGHWFDQLIAWGPSLPLATQLAAWRWKGRAMERSDELTAARDAFQMVLDLGLESMPRNENIEQALLGLSRYAESQNKLDEAATYARQAQAQFPGSDRPWLRLAQIAVVEQDWSTAAQAASEARALNDSAESYYLSAQSAAAQGQDLCDVFEFARTATEIAPAITRYQQLRDRIAEQIGDLNQCAVN